MFSRVAFVAIATSFTFSVALHRREAAQRLNAHSKDDPSDDWLRAAAEELVSWSTAQDEVGEKPGNADGYDFAELANEDLEPVGYATQDVATEDTWNQPE